MIIGKRIVPGSKEDLDRPGKARAFLLILLSRVCPAALLTARLKSRPTPGLMLAKARLNAYAFARFRGLRAASSNVAWPTQPRNTRRIHV